MVGIVICSQSWASGDVISGEDLTPIAGSPNFVFDSSRSFRERKSQRHNLWRRQRRTTTIALSASACRVKTNKSAIVLTPLLTCNIIIGWFQTSATNKQTNKKPTWQEIDKNCHLCEMSLQDQETQQNVFFPQPLVASNKSATAAIVKRSADSPFSPNRRSNSSLDGNCHSIRVGRTDGRNALGIAKWLKNDKSVRDRPCVYQCARNFFNRQTNQLNILVHLQLPWFHNTYHFKVLLHLLPLSVI